MFNCYVFLPQSVSPEANLAWNYTRVICSVIHWEWMGYVLSLAILGDQGMSLQPVLRPCSPRMALHLKTHRQTKCLNIKPLEKLRFQKAIGQVNIESQKVSADWLNFNFYASNLKIQWVWCPIFVKLLHQQWIQLQLSNAVRVPQKNTAIPSGKMATWAGCFQMFGGVSFASFGWYRRVYDNKNPSQSSKRDNTLDLFTTSHPCVAKPRF